MSDFHPDQEEDRPRRRWLWILLSVAVFFGVLMLLWEVEDTADVTARSDPPSAPIVTVIEVAPTTAEASVAVFAELRPRWDAHVRSAVSGQIVEVFDAALAGTRVQVGTPLIALQRTQFETAVAEAEVALEQARLTHLQAQNQVAIAQRQFERDARQPPNDLALNLPQLRIAERGLTAAELQLKAARRQLSDTVVTAPFSGFVTERMASLGQTVTAGDILLRLSDDQQFEIVASLSQSKWSLLKQPIAGGRAKLFHRNGEPLGTALIRQGGGFLDPDTRQVRVFLDVSSGQASVLSGDFLRVEFAGRALANTLTLPEQVLTQNGFIWFVTEENRLERHLPKVLFRDGGSIVIASPAGGGPRKVAKSPLASFLPGQQVTPQQTEG